MKKYVMDSESLSKGNKVIGELNLENSNIKFIGNNNILVINGDLSLINSSIEFRGDNSLVYLCGTNDIITLDLKLYYNSTFYIGEYVWINRGIKIVLSEQTNVFFGRDCLISYDTCIRTGDPHVIYSIDSHERINESKSVYVGDHVWIGQDVMILKGVKIGSGSILGAKSLVTAKKYKSNCVYGGNPVKLVKSGVFFLKDDCHRFKDDDVVKYSMCLKDDFIYEKDNNLISFDEIEKNLNDLDIIEKIKYLDDITNNKNKNRFFI